MHLRLMHHLHTPANGVQQLVYILSPLSLPRKDNFAPSSLRTTPARTLFMTFENVLAYTVFHRIETADLDI